MHLTLRVDAAVNVGEGTLRGARVAEQLIVRVTIQRLTRPLGAGDEMAYHLGGGRGGASVSTRLVWQQYSRASQHKGVCSKQQAARSTQQTAGNRHQATRGSSLLHSRPSASTERAHARAWRLPGAWRRARRGCASHARGSEEATPLGRMRCRDTACRDPVHTGA